MTPSCVVVIVVFVCLGVEVFGAWVGSEVACVCVFGVEVLSGGAA